jgi:pimeloyl-ACP methyl ester carboxylesterase
MYVKRFAVLITTLLCASVAHAMTPSPELAAAPSHYARLDGVRIHYKLLGRGKSNLVFVHGLGGDMNVWREQVAHFAPKARILVLDLPGFGGSDKPESVKYTMRYFAKAVRAAMDDAKMDRAILVGHSMGTPVIREFDRFYPSRSRGLVAVDGFLVNNTPVEAMEKFIASFRGAEYADSLGKMFDGMAPQASPALRDEIKTTALATPQYVFVSASEGMFLDKSIWKDDKITSPLLVVNTTSPMWSEKYIAAVRTLAPDMRYEKVDGADHFLMLEKPEALNAAIESWMKAKKLLR